MYFIAGTAPRLLAPLQDMTVESDRPVEMTCQYEASPSPSIQWYREGAMINPSTDFNVSTTQHAVYKVQTLENINKTAINSKIHLM